MSDFFLIMYKTYIFVYVALCVCVCVCECIFLITALIIRTCASRSF